MGGDQSQEEKTPEQAFAIHGILHQTPPMQTSVCVKDAESAQSRECAFEAWSESVRIDRLEPCEGPSSQSSALNRR